MSQSAEDIDLNPPITEPDKEELSNTAPDVKRESCLDPLLDTYYLDVKVFIEGVQVPHAQCSVSYGIGNPPTATIVIPANNFLRDIPATTKVHIVHRDLLPNEDGEYRDRLLFDGEITGYSYMIDPSGAQITLHAIHCGAYLTIMQLMCQEVREYMMDNTWAALGDKVCYLSSNFNSLQICLMGAIIDHKKDNIKSMADIIYLMLNYIINESKEYTVGALDTSAAYWYYCKLGSVKGTLRSSFRIVDRIYGVSDAAKNAGKLGDYTDNWKDKLGNFKETAPELGAMVPDAANNPPVPKSGSVTNPEAFIGEMSDAIYKKLISLGYTPAGACAMLGNFTQESSLNPSIDEDDVNDGNSSGLGQWHKERRDDLRAFAKSKGKNWNDAMLQVDFMHYELDPASSSQRSAGGSFPKTNKYLKNCNTREDISKTIHVIVDEYTRPLYKHYEDRTTYAYAYYDHYVAKKQAK